MFDEFRLHLTALEHNYAVKLWIDEVLEAGTNWRDGIKDAIEKADIFIIMLSPAFLASNFIHNTEFPAIKERYEAVKSPIVPVYLKRCMYKPICGDLQNVPHTNGQLRPIQEWKVRNAGFHTANEQIELILRTRLGLAPIVRKDRLS